MINIKELDAVIKNLDITNKKLNNPDFVYKAPKDIVDKERKKSYDFKSSYEYYFNLIIDYLKYRFGKNIDWQIEYQRELDYNWSDYDDYEFFEKEISTFNKPKSDSEIISLYKKLHNVKPKKV